MPNRMYIRFAGDNDYINTVKAFVKIIAPKILLGHWGHITKEEIVALFNAHAYSLYVLCQCSHINTNDESVRDYLKIEVKDVYFNDEIDLHTNFNNDGCLAAIEHDKIGYYFF